jgi:hypothetical protein
MINLNTNKTLTKDPGGKMTNKKKQGPNQRQ